MLSLWGMWVSCNISLVKNYFYDATRKHSLDIELCTRPL